MLRRETQHQHLTVVRDAELDIDLAVVAHHRVSEDRLGELGGRAAMVAAFRAGGVDELRAERDALRDDLLEAQQELEELRALRDAVTVALAERSAA